MKKIFINRIGRRQFIKTSLSGLALATLPRISFAQSNPDVVVIGAGAAGLAATQELMKQGKSVVCIEAMNRIGGRVYTDNSIFGVPYDMGAHWLECYDGNPIVKYGLKNKKKFKIYKDKEKDAVYDGKKEVKGTGPWKLYTRATGWFANVTKDIAAIDTIPQKLKDDEWFDTVHMIMGPSGPARDLGNLSCYDENAYWDGPDGEGFCKQGYGALVAHYRKDVPVKLKTTAKEIKWDGQGVQVETNKGTISAKACIVTVSTGVLNARKIKFTPDLSPEKYESFAGITMGVYNHITFQFKRRPFGLNKRDTYFYSKIHSNGAVSPKGGLGVLNLCGTNISYFDTGGKFSEELEAEGSKAQIDFFLNNLRTHFGSKVDKYLIKAHATSWGKNPFTLGSYAGAIPGKALIDHLTSLREVLKESVGDRIFFAGEACAKAYATVYGANDSGTKIGKKVAKKV
jgi:monoamine oxidase